MKKFIYIVLSVILLLSAIIFIPACDKNQTNDGFEIVSEITFVNNGESITKTSKSYTEYNTIRAITKNEFVSKETQKKQAENNNQTVDFEIHYWPVNGSDGRNLSPQYWTDSFIKTLNVSSKNVKYFSESSDKTVYYVAYYTHMTISFTPGSGSKVLDDCVRFAELQRKGTLYVFVLVKIIDPQTIQVADKNGITTYIVTSYSIKYIQRTKNQENG